MKSSCINWDELPWFNMWGGNDVGMKIFEAGDASITYSRIAPSHKGNPHKHTNAQIVMFLEGSVDLYLNGVCHNVTNDDVIFVPANVEHYAIPTSEKDVIGLEIFLPKRDDYVEKYSAFLKEIAHK